MEMELDGSSGAFVVVLVSILPIYGVLSGDNELTPSRGVFCQYLSDVVNLIEKPR